MSAVNLTNLTGSPVNIVTLKVNTAAIQIPAPTPENPSNTESAAGQILAHGDTLLGNYDGGVASADFTDLQISVTMNGGPNKGNTYSMDLSPSYYFGGAQYHYPGSDSDVNYVLLGFNTPDAKIVTMLSYRESGSGDYIYSADTSNFLEEGTL